LGESVMYGTVCGFAETFFEEFVVAVVVAEYADKGAVQLCQLGDNESCDVVACVEHQTNFQGVEGFHGFFYLWQVIVGIGNCTNQHYNAQMFFLALGNKGFLLPFRTPAIFGNVKK